MYYRMIFSLILCNFLEACANLFSLGVYNHEVQLYAECYTQGTLLQFTEVATFGWVMAITLNLYLVVVFHYKDVKHRTEYVYHCVVWGFALLAAGLPWFNKAYGIAGIWCWIIWDYQIYRWCLYYIPLFLVIVAVIVLYSLIYSTVIANLKEQKDEKHKAEAKNLLAKLRAYPIVFFIIYVFSITNRIYDWLSPDDSFPLYVLESLTTPLIGFVNSIVYLANSETRALWIKKLHDMGCCLRLTTPAMKHEEFQEDDGEITFDVPDVTETSKSQDPNLF